MSYKCKATQTLVRHTKQSVAKPKSRTNKGYKESYLSHAKGSLCSIKASSYKNPDYLRIRFAGPAAQVPSLKNEKIQGMNILRPEAKAKLSVMTDLFIRACEFKIPQYDPKFPVFCLVLCAYRKNTFDEDNVATTVKDWLEPKFIRQKDRGWGVGVVPNDRMIKVYAIKKKKSDPDSHITEILIRPYDKMQAFEDLFLQSILT